MMHNRTILINGVNYYVRTEGQGEPVLLLHGFTGTANTWAKLIEEYKHQYLFIAPDLLGHGRTEIPEKAERYSMEQAARDMKELVNSLGFESVHVLGYSMGGRLALGTAMLYPDLAKSLVLESASPGLQTEKERQNRKANDANLANRILHKGIEEFVEEWTTIPLFSSQNRLPIDVKEAIRKERLSHKEEGLANSLLGMGTGSQPSWWEQLQSLQIPVLLVTGELDEKFIHIAKRMEISLPISQFVMIHGVGHAIHVEDWREFGKIVIGFFENIK